MQKICEKLGFWTLFEQNFTKIANFWAFAAEIVDFWRFSSRKNRLLLNFSLKNRKNVKISSVKNLIFSHFFQQNLSFSGLNYWFFLDFLGFQTKESLNNPFLGRIFYLFFPIFAQLTSQTVSKIVLMLNFELLVELSSISDVSVHTFHQFVGRFLHQTAQLANWPWKIQKFRHF